MKVYRQTADASMYYRESAAANSAGINSSAFPTSFPRVVESPVVFPPVVFPNAEVIEPEVDGNRNNPPQRPTA